MFNGDIDDDCLMLESILSQLTYKSGADRYKLCPTRKGNGSILYGNTWRAFLKYGEPDAATGIRPMIYRKKDPDAVGKYLSRAQEIYPQLQEIFEEFRDYHFADFDFSHVMMNRNYDVDWHRDAANVGESVVIAMGDFTGGSTQIKDVDGVITNLDSHNNPQQFDGSKIEHRVEPFEGERYSLVFFKN